jgi:hypothetical protein
MSGMSMQIERTARALILATCGMLLLVAHGCTRGPEVEGYDKCPMARQVVERYLKCLDRGEYAQAASLFAGPREMLKLAAAPEHPAGPQPASDVAALFEGYMRSHPDCCRAFAIREVRLVEPYCFLVTVTFKRRGSDDVTAEFRVDYDGQRYRVLGLPPAK